jgi:hypothetical protein
MTTNKIKRSQIATFVNVSSTSGASYKLLGVGVTTGKIDMNPKMTEETYIDQDTADISVDSYAPKMPISMTAVSTDPIFAFVENLYRTRAVLGDAETDIVDVYYYSSSSGGAYPADQQNVAISVEDYGGDGGTPAKISFTFNYLGGRTSGKFNVSSGTFTAS